MFRTQDNVPQYYIDKSRDFQLIGRLLDLIVNDLKFDIDSICNILDPLEARDNLLVLLAERVGYFPEFEINSEVLRYVISAFPYIMKKKGSVRSFEEAANAVLKAESHAEAARSVEIIVIQKQPNLAYKNIADTVKYDPNEEYIVQIILPTKVQHLKVLEDILTYIIPAGMMYSIIYQGDSPDPVTTSVWSDSETDITQITGANRSNIFMDSITDPEKITPLGQPAAGSFDTLTIYEEPTEGEQA